MPSCWPRFALVGGFLTPVLISTGQNHEIALFSYLALLDLGTLWISAVRRWPRLLLGAYIGTALLFSRLGRHLLHRRPARTDLLVRDLLFPVVRQRRLFSAATISRQPIANLMVVLDPAECCRIFCGHAISC